METLAEAEKFLRERFLDTYRTETGWRYAVCLREEPERPVGYVNIAPGEAHDLATDWEGLLAPGTDDRSGPGGGGTGAQGRGTALLTATHDVLNPRSGGVMQNIGMTYRYTYRERVEPKRNGWAFRFYQLNLTEPADYVWKGYWESHPSTGSRTPACDFPQRRQSGVEKGGLCGTGVRNPASRQVPQGKPGQCVQ